LSLDIHYNSIILAAAKNKIRVSLEIVLVKL